MGNGLGDVLGLALARSLLQVFGRPDLLHGGEVLPLPLLPLPLPALDLCFDLESPLLVAFDCFPISGAVQRGGGQSGRFLAAGCACTCLFLRQPELFRPDTLAVRPGKVWCGVVYLL